MRARTETTRIILLAVLLSLSAAVALAGQSGGAGRVDISFDYAKLRGFASNQFAVWIEREDGGYLRTIFVTEWTAKGGWKKRPLALANWVKASDLPEMDRYDLNAISAATPKTGRQEFSWDCTDKAGKPVPDGRYRIWVEGTLRNENVVLLTAEVEVGSGTYTPDVSTKFLGEETKDRGMLQNVKVEYIAD